MHVRFLPGISLTEVNALARQWNGDRSRVVAVSAPEKPGLAVPGEAELARIVQASAAAPAAAYVDSAPDAALLAERPAPGTITAREGDARGGHHRVDAVERGPGRAAPHDVQAGRSVLPRDQPRRRVAGVRRRLCGRRRPRRRWSRPAASAGSMPSRWTRSSPGRSPPCCRSSRSRSKGWPAEGPRADLETHPAAGLPSIHEAQGGRHRLRRHDGAAEVDGREPRRRSRDALRGHGLGGALAEPLPEAAAVAPAPRGDEPREVVRVLQGPLCRRGRLRLRVRGELRPGCRPPARRRSTWRRCRPPGGRKAGGTRASRRSAASWRRWSRRDSSPRAACASCSRARSGGIPPQRVLLRVLGLVLEGQLGAVLREDQSGTYGVKVTTRASDKVPSPRTPCRSTSAARPSAPRIS